MSTILALIRREPAVISGALVAVLNVLVLLDVVALSGDQLAAIDAAAVAVLALFVRANVTPTVKLDADA